MEASTSNQRTNQQSEADRMQQEHMAKLREIKKKQQIELQDVQDKHEMTMKEIDTAYKVELGAKTGEYDRKTK